MAIDPTGADLKRLLAEDDDGPVVMLNLLRFAPDGGRERYAEYAREIGRTFLPRYGGEVLFAGDGTSPWSPRPARTGTRSCWCATRAGRRSAGWSQTPSTSRSPTCAPRL